MSELSNNDITDEIKSIINNVSIKQNIEQCSPVKKFKQPLHPKFIQRVSKPVITPKETKEVLQTNIIEQTNIMKNKFDKHHLLKAKSKR